MTAVLVLQEVERAGLSLDATIAQTLPNFRGPAAARITIRQLLQHTSGLPNPETGAPEGTVPAFHRRIRAPRAAITDANGVCAAAVQRAAGESFEYNNCDYIVLGAILEQRTGRTFAELVRSRVAEPLRLLSVRVSEGRRLAPRSIVGYVGGRPAPLMNEATYGAAGALFGTVDDMLTFDDALMRGKLLSPASLEILWAGEPKFGYVALGAWSFPASLAGCASEVALVERRGDIGGMQVRNLMAPALKRALVMVTNNGDFDFGEIWQGKGATWAVASAAFCGGSPLAL